MRKITCFFVFYLLLANTALGQVPTYFNNNAVVAGNNFPLNTAVSNTRRVQWSIPAGVLTGAPSNWNITAVYFQTASAATKVYPTLNIRLKTGTPAGLTGIIGGPVELGMTLVYQGINASVVSTAGGWIKFTLQTPFLYDPSVPLLVELEQDGTTAGGPSIMHDAVFPGAGNPRQWADFSGVSNVVTSNATTAAGYLHFGIDVSPATPCSGFPAASTVAVTTASTCPGNTVGLSLGTSYTGGGISYQWESSTTGINGLYTSVPGATTSALNTSSLTTTTAYRAVITCSNGPLSTTATPVLVNIGPPSVSGAVTPLPLLCSGLTNTMNLNGSYQGVSYQWQTSSVSIVGPYFNVVPFGTLAINSGTNPVYSTPSLTMTTYYHAVLSCTAAPSLTTITMPVAVNIAPATTTNSVPYDEGFEGVGVPNYMPNCSWSASSPTLVNQTYTSSASANRSAHNGAKFASFKSPTSTNGDYFYTNGIQMEPGITYSASVWYTTDGALGWTDFGLFLGTSQSPAGLTNIVSSNAGLMVNTYYKHLSSTFTVGASGLYYVAVRAKGSGANYLSFDDLSITAPCSLNNPVIAVSGPNSGCVGQTILLSATGADTYTWNGTVFTSTLGYQVTGNASIPLSGKNIGSGCVSATNVIISANPSPVVGILAPNTNVCKGSSAVMIAYGADSYNWTTGANTSSVTISPTVNSTYTVIGVNSYGCGASASQLITVKNLPLIASLASANQMCTGETVTLTATGANSYTWSSNNNYIVGASVLVSPFVTTTYTVTGTDVSGCKGFNFTAVAVSPCTELGELNSSLHDVKLFPNPNNGNFTLETGGDDEKTIELTDIAGKLISTQKTSTKKIYVQVNELTPGLYFMKITSHHSTSVLKFVKE